MTFATVAGAAAGAAFSNRQRLQLSKFSSEFLLSTICSLNPSSGSQFVSSRCWKTADRSDRRRLALNVVFRRAADPSSSSSSAPETTSKGMDDDETQSPINKGWSGEVDGEDRDEDENDDRGFSSSNAKQVEQTPRSIRLDDVNPVGLGRRSRQIFDEVWRKFSGLGQISRTTRTDDETSLLINEMGGPMCEFAIPGAQNTTVLVVGATSRVGRIVVRKLMLRGYTVKALVRKADQQVVDMLPTSVEIVVGDVGDPSSLKAAVIGCNKIIYCATARSSITGDLNRVDHQGVYNLTKAFQVFFLK